MKKLFVFAAVFVAFASQAQVKFAPGIRAGANFAQLTETDLGIKTDFYVAGFAGIKFTKHYTLQPELTYSRQGAKGDYQIYAPVYDNNGDLVSEYANKSADVSLQYVSLGLMNKFTFADRISIVVGPTVDVLVKDNAQYTQDIDLALQLGLGVRLVDGLEFEFRLKKGIVNAVEDADYIDEHEFFGFHDATNFVMQVGLGYTFGR
jgi:hypothetical protein